METLEDQARAPVGGSGPDPEASTAPDALPPSSGPAAIGPGSELAGRYRIERELGRGGMGRVFAAWDPQLSRRVAIKLLTAGAHRQQALERFAQEARAAGALSHPNVVAIYDAGSWRGEPFLVSELLEGETLRARLARGALPLEEAITLAAQLAEGLAAAHAKGVIHRDLKPENVVLTAEGRAKILDFGIAKLLLPADPLDGPTDDGAGGARAVSTVTGQVMGTPRYMSPEQLRGDRVDARTDLFSFGALLYEVLAGRMAFEAHTPAEATAAVLDATPPPLPGGVPARLEALVARCLEKDARKRPASAAEVAAELAAIRPQPRRFPSLHSSPFARRRPLAFLLVLLPLLAAALVIWLRSAPQAAGAAGTTVAVLPFADLSPQKDQEYFSDGIAEEILDALSRVPGLRVAGRTSSFSFKGAAQDVRAIGQKLGVGTVLEGSVRRAGNRARITAKIVNVSDGFTVWSQAYDRELTDVFAVQEEIARAVVSALRLRLAAQDAPSVASRRTARPEVYDAYLAARSLLRKADMESCTAAVAAYERTIALEPGYAPAWADLAEALFWVSDMNAEKQIQEEYRRRALSAADRAVALGPELAAAWSVRGSLRVWLRWDFDGGQKDFERALALAGGDSRVLRDYGSNILVPLGRLQEGIAAMTRAAELDPLDPMTWFYLAISWPAAGDTARGLRAAERALEVAPSNPYAALWRCLIPILEGRAGEGLALARQHFAPGRQEFEGQLWIVEAIAQHSLGDAQASRHALGQIEAKYALTAAYQIGAIHAWRGEAAEAFAWLERSIAQQDVGAVQLTRDPFLRSLRGDPRWAALLRKMNLPAPAGRPQSAR